MAIHVTDRQTERQNYDSNSVHPMTRADKTIDQWLRRLELTLAAHDGHTSQLCGICRTVLLSNTR